MDFTHIMPVAINWDSTTSKASGLSFKRAFQAVERGESLVLSRENACSIQLAYEIACAVLFIGSQVSYMPTVSLGTSYGYLEYSNPPGVNDTFYPNTNVQILTGTAFYGSFVIAALATYLFMRAYGCCCDSSSNLFADSENGKIIASAELSVLKLKLQQDLVFESIDQEDSVLPNSYIKDIFPLLSSEDKKTLNFQQLKALRQHDAVAFKRELKARSFAENEELHWNKIEALLSGCLKPSTNPSEKDSLLHAGRTNDDSQALQRLQAALKNVNNRIYLRNIDVLEVLIHELPLKTEGKIAKTLGKYLAAVVGPNRSLNRSWEQYVLAMHRQKCSLQMVERSMARPAKHDAKFQVFNQQIVTFNAQLLAANSEPFRCILFGKMQGGRNVDPSAPKELPEVDAAAFKALIALLEGQTWQQINCSTATLCALAMLVDYYGVTSLHSLIQEQLIASIRTVSDAFLDQFLETHQCCNLPMPNFDRHLDHFLALKYFRPQQFSFPLTKSFMYKLEFALRRKLPKCSAEIKRYFLNSLNHSESILKETLDGLADLLLAMEACDHGAFQLLWKELDVWLDRAPTALGILWDKACQNKKVSIQKCIVAFCQQPQAHHIWLANWSTPPTAPETQLIEIK